MCASGRLISTRTHGAGTHRSEWVAAQPATRGDERVIEQRGHLERVSVPRRVDEVRPQHPALVDRGIRGDGAREVSTHVVDTAVEQERVIALYQRGRSVTFARLVQQT
jgi:hypothetical protein